jgi:hypothetical protein
VDALLLALINECNRAVEQALKNQASGQRTSEGGLYETCFLHILLEHKVTVK